MRALLLLLIAFFRQVVPAPEPRIPPLPTEGEFAAQLERKNASTYPLVVTEQQLLRADATKSAELLPAGDELVIGIEVDGEARAYPIKLINNDDLMNDTVRGRPVLASWCQACQSAMVYERTLDGKTVSIGNTHATYLGTAVFYDMESRSFWTQANGVCVFGPSLGKTLAPLVSRVATWEDWKRSHPATRVVGGTVPFGDRRSRFALFGATGKDLARVGVVVRDGKSVRFYRGDHFEAGGLVADVLDGTPLVVVLDGEHRVMQAWKRTVGEQTLELELTGRGTKEPLVLAERGGARRWDAGDGHPLVEACAGVALTPIACQSIRANRYAALFPDGSSFGKKAK